MRLPNKIETYLVVFAVIAILPSIPLIVFHSSDNVRNTYHANCLHAYYGEGTETAEKCMRCREVCLQAGGTPDFRFYSESMTEYYYLDEPVCFCRAQTPNEMLTYQIHDYNYVNIEKYNATLIKNDTFLTNVEDLIVNL